MATTTETQIGTFAELHKRLGEVPLERILMSPAPGTATEADVIAMEAKTDRLCELVDGVLVEKTMGVQESCLAALLIAALVDFVEAGNLGLVTAPDGAVRLFPGLVRIPDVAFFSWEKFPEQMVPEDPISAVVPDLAVEILSPSNSRGEMTRKRHDYFDSGVRLVWYVDPSTRTVTVYDALDSVIVLKEGDILEGGDLLPGLRIDLARLFSRVRPRS